MFRGRVRHVHFIGIGGIGMSGLAEILRTMDFDVSGSDMKASDVTRRLETLGIKVQVGHKAENVHGADVVVHSSAIAQNNPELARARAMEIPAISRGEMLAELMRVKYCVLMAGSHGKTTTTSARASSPGTSSRKARTSARTPCDSYAARSASSCPRPL